MSVIRNKMVLLWRHAQEPYDLRYSDPIEPSDASLAQVLCLHYDLMGLKGASFASLEQLDVLRKQEEKKTIQQRLNDAIGINPMQFLCQFPHVLATQKSPISLMAKKQKEISSGDLEELASIPGSCALEVLDEFTKRWGYQSGSLCLKQDSVIVSLMEKQHYKMNPDSALVRQPLNAVQWDQAQQWIGQYLKQYEQDRQYAQVALNVTKQKNNDTKEVQIEKKEESTDTFRALSCGLPKKRFK